MKTPFAKINPHPSGSISDIVSAEDAEARKDYFCPDCGKIVRVRKSPKGLLHFFHVGKDCSTGGLETTLHLMAKEIVKSQKMIFLSDCILNYNAPLPVKEIDGTYRRIKRKNNNPMKFFSKFEGNHPPYLYVYIGEEKATQSHLLQRKTKLKHKFGLVALEKVVIEKRLSDIKPDIVAEIDGRSIAIEMVYSHSVEELTLRKFIEQDIPCIEVDLKSYFSYYEKLTYESLTDYLTSRKCVSQWLYYSYLGDSKFSEEERVKMDKLFIDEMLAYKKRSG